MSSVILSAVLNQWSQHTSCEQLHFFKSITWKLYEQILLTILKHVAVTTPCTALKMYP